MAYTNIKKSSDYFNTKLYTANGGTLSVTGVGFQPDLVWGKQRTNAENHELYDAVRGTTKRIQSNLSDAETTSASYLTSFDSDGFSLGSATRLNNTNGATCVSWNWLANGAGVANTDGTISSTVSANTTSGFSIVSYTGTGANATVGHGLSSTPKFVAIKNRTTTGWSWKTHHVGITPSQRLHLNSTDAATTDTTCFNSTAPTSSVFSVGTSIGTNGSSDNMIAYCFADVQGFSKFGSYVGNGNDDGTFVYTGFKPAFVLVKRTDATGSWSLIDNTRDPFNVTYHFLKPDVSDVEFIPSGPQAAFDFCSQGFKCRSTNSSINAGGGSYIYMAFAEQPLVGDNPATAR